jgi:DNA repair protein RadA/Sms
MSKKLLLQQYVCQECGSVQSKWGGKCLDCGAWNSLVAETVIKNKSAVSLNEKFIKTADFSIETLNDNLSEYSRISTGNSEFDRVLGGGLVAGSAILLGGDPGIGKSTLVIQIINDLATQGHNCLYISGEESVDQIKLRAKRLQLKSDNARLASITSLDQIKIAIEKYPPKFLVIDSIQTVYNEEIESAPGSISQVRSTAFELIRIAKNSSIAVILVGHVTKEGTIAGPKVLEHMVDTVLYFEGDRGYQYRIIRAVKNRFGASNEIGVFEMLSLGLREVKNPSEMFLPDKGSQNISGSCVFAGIEGTRPVLLEIQALVVPSFLPTPRRAVVGWDVNRLSMIIAVLNARLGINLLDKEVYLNVAGGLKINEPAADLAAVQALISAASNIPTSRECAFFGEIGLSGEVRQVAQAEQRISEAEKLGFKKIILPEGVKNNTCNIQVIPVNHISDLRKTL